MRDFDGRKEIRSIREYHDLDKSNKKLMVDQHTREKTNNLERNRYSGKKCRKKGGEILSYNFGTCAQKPFGHQQHTWIIYKPSG